MKTINSIQLVAVFIAWPYLINWLDTAQFSGAPAAYYAACVIYFISFVIMVICVRAALADDGILNW